MRALNNRDWQYGKQLSVRGINLSSVYVFLKRLEIKGVVDVDRGPSIARPLYRLNTVGHIVLNAWEKLNERSLRRRT